MKISASVYIATSLDGFIAREDGAIDWLLEANTLIPPGEDCGYARFMASVDVLIMGSGTYEQVSAFDSWPYGDMRVVVLSSGNLVPRSQAEARVEGSSESPGALLDRLGEEGHRHAYVDGGKVVQSFLAEGLIDRITITTIPVLLGRGRRLFGDLPRDRKLQLLHSMAYPFGFVQSTYQVLSSQPSS